MEAKNHRKHEKGCERIEEETPEQGAEGAERCFECVAQKESDPCYAVARWTMQKKLYSVKHFCSVLRKVLIVRSYIIRSCLIRKYFYCDSN